MKKAFVIQVYMLFRLISGGQDLASIFSQHSADLKDMTKQIALLQLYLNGAEKGYQIVKSGLQTIAGVKQDEYNLHSLFFGSLSLINPVIKRWKGIDATIEYQTSITKELDQVNEIGHLQPEEQDHLFQLKENLLGDCARDMDALIDILSDHTYQMSDDDRLRTIGRIYLNMKKRWQLSKELVEGAVLLASERQWETDDIRNLKNLEK